MQQKWPSFIFVKLFGTPAKRPDIGLVGLTFFPIRRVRPNRARSHPRNCTHLVSLDDRYTHRLISRGGIQRFNDVPGSTFGLKFRQETSRMTSSNHAHQIKRCRHIFVSLLSKLIKRIHEYIDTHKKCNCKQRANGTIRWQLRFEWWGCDEIVAGPMPPFPRSNRPAKFNTVTQISLSVFF